ncbi:hypothetical protein EVAR_42764_1 [Eumeta japonica]|uniref:Uncharacterized protein n=1 Tax=Eumeta variegata TaxID=151549 RepID=A0A4C1WKN6_EUMVA|nr:hypothetical protein EVAR_42764_1 [Eumeta japonica]
MWRSRTPTHAPAPAAHVTTHGDDQLRHSLFSSLTPVAIVPITGATSRRAGGACGAPTCILIDAGKDKSLNAVDACCDQGLHEKGPTRSARYRTFTECIREVTAFGGGFHIVSADDHEYPGGPHARFPLKCHEKKKYVGREGTRTMYIILCARRTTTAGNTTPRWTSGDTPAVKVKTPLQICHRS